MSAKYSIGDLVRVANPEHFISVFARRIEGRVGLIDGVLGTALRPTERRYRIRFPKVGRRPEFVTSYEFNARDLAQVAEPAATTREGQER